MLHRSIRLGAFLLLSVAAGVPSAMAQQACAGNQDFAGPFVFTANRLSWTFTASPPGSSTSGVVWTPVAVTPPGSTGQFTTTTVGRLAVGGFGAGPFSLVGRLFADGGGTLFSSPELMPIGTYDVKPDCSLTLSLRDATSRTAAVSAARVEFAGVLRDRGRAASLVQTNAGLQTSLELVRPLLNQGCSNGSLSGSYGLAGFGLQFFPPPGGSSSSTTPQNVTPFSIVGRVFSDGLGRFVLDNAATSSMPRSGTFTGSYEVREDCTGTATVSADDGKTNYTLPFVLTAGSKTGADGITSATSPRPVIEFVIASPFSGRGSGN